MGIALLAGTLNFAMQAVKLLTGLWLAITAAGPSSRFAAICSSCHSGGAPSERRDKKGGSSSCSIEIKYRTDNEREIDQDRSDEGIDNQS
jgi:hypothetical protein